METRAIIEQFRLAGLQLRKDTLKYLANELRDEEQWENVLLKIVHQCAQYQVNNGIVDVETVKLAIAELTKSVTETIDDFIQVYDAFHTPWLHYDPSRRIYYTERLSKGVCSTCEDRIHAIRERLQFIKNRVEYNQSYKYISMNERRPNLELVSIESMIGTQSEYAILGYIYHNSRDELLIEDLNGKVRLNADKASWSIGIYTENIIVVAIGRMEDDVFVASHILQPQFESREQSMTFLSQLQLLGLSNSSNEYEVIKSKEEFYQKKMLLIMQEIYLDEPEVLTKLDILFQKYSSVHSYPTFLFIGNFASKYSLSGNEYDPMYLSQAFDGLATILKKYEDITSNSMFIFVPGNRDLGPNTMLPQYPLSEQVISSLRTVCKKVVFTSNPTRIRFFTHEIAVFKDDLIRQTRNSNIHISNEEDVDYAELLVSTIAHESHLYPVSTSLSKILYKYDSFFRLFPMPHAIHLYKVVLADNYDAYVRGCDQCNFVNPGIFSRDFSFLICRPNMNSFECNTIEQ